MPKQIRKRDGCLETWSTQRIAQAILKGLKASGIQDPLLATRLAHKVEAKLEAVDVPEQEHVQDAVELVLMLQGRSITHFETKRLRKDGVLVDVSLNISPIRDPDGTIVGLSTIARDVTSRKRLRRELVAAKREAVAASQAKSEFLANMYSIFCPVRKRIQTCGRGPSRGLRPDGLAEWPLGDGVPKLFELALGEHHGLQHPGQLGIVAGVLGEDCGGLHGRAAPVRARRHPRRQVRRRA